MAAVRPNLLRERARDRFLNLLRSEYWTEAESNEHGLDSQSLSDASQVVDELAGVPHDLYRRVRDDLVAQREPRGDTVVTMFQKAALSGQPVQSGDDRVVELHRELIGWLDRWHLRSEWMFERAFRTLDLWCSSDERWVRRSWAPTLANILSGPLRFPVDDWDGTEPLSAYRSRGLKALSAGFGEYCDEIERMAKGGGEPLAFDRHGARALRWTIRTQVLGQPAVEVAIDEDVAQSTVESAIRGLLQHLDLTPRARPPGRPRGSKDKMPRQRRLGKPSD